MDLPLYGAGVNPGILDGIFGKKTHAAVKQFQEHAAKGEMQDQQGAAVELAEEDRLKGHRAGTSDPPTRKVLEKCVEKGIVVPAASDASGGGTNDDRILARINQRIALR